MPTADATILPPPFSSAAEYERGSTRRLDEVGVETVLEAMLETNLKRRSSQPSFAAIDRIELPRDEDHESQPPGGRSPVSEVFLKAR